MTSLNIVDYGTDNNVQHNNLFQVFVMKLYIIFLVFIIGVLFIIIFIIIIINLIIFGPYTLCHYSMVERHNYILVFCKCLQCVFVSV